MAANNQQQQQQETVAKVVVNYSEMNEADQLIVADIATNAMKLIEKGEKTIFHKDIAEFMKKELDAQKGGSWNCIVGISFGSFVTHETKTLSHIAIGNVQIMIWRHG